MNWYKKAQQGLLFYPYKGAPEDSSQKTLPISVDPESGQNIYKCHHCGQPVLEEYVEWYKDIEGKGEEMSLPQYNVARISEALTSISQYLAPFLEQLFKYIQENNLESKRNNTYDYGFRSEVSIWEAQVPQLVNIANSYPELKDICSFKRIFYSMDDICSLLNSNGEINGSTLLSLEEFIKNPTATIDEMKGYAGKQFSLPYQVPVCEECFEGFNTCESCDKVIPPGHTKYQTTWDDDSYVCEECVEDGRMGLCQNCGKADSFEDMHYNEDEGNTCSDCYKNMTSKRIEWAEDVLSGLDLPVGKNNPISSKVLDNLFEFLGRYIRKYGNNYLNEKEYGRLMHMGRKSGLSSGSVEYLESIAESHNVTKDSYSHRQIMDIFNDVVNNLDAQEYIQEQYPGIKNYQDIPFDITVMENFSKDKQGFTIGITPSDEFFDYAEKKYPGIKGVWDKMNRTPHHSGVLAYARCAYEGGDSIVINNLQRDADLDNYMAKVYAPSGTEEGQAKWLNNVTKHWDVFLLNLLKAMGIAKNVSVFLTTFDQQKSKWGNLPIHKAKKTYGEIPENMGFQLQDPTGGAESLVEENSFYGDPMYQIATNMNWYKKAQLQETLPYFQEFEEYGEYVPNEDSLNEKLNSMGLSLGTEISRGDSGVAYNLSNGDVLKITTNDQEGKVASYIMQNPHPAIVSYKAVWKDGDLYFIIMEHLSKMISDIPAIKNIFDKINKIIDSFSCYNVNCAYDIIMDNSYFNSLLPDIKHNITEYLQHLKSIPMPIFDFLNPNNVGVQNGKIKFFDIT